MSYRSDIDGLRAVSIFLILVYHVSSPAIPGGFIGVDVFFVISGFLITRIIWAGLQDESFTFVDFYAGRVRRIFPAVILVLISCLVLGWHSLFAHEFKLLGKHVAASAGFVSNVVYQSEGGYFDLDSAEKPLLHLWSLAIEEQFYLVWPLILWGAWRVTAASDASPTKRLLRVVLCAGALSLLLSVFLTWVRPEFVFYFLPTRAWELCAGALLVALPAITRSLWIELCAFFGVICIALSAAFFSHDMVYPGWAACGPVIGAMALIAAGPHSWVSRYCLSTPMLVQLGKLSFAIYLWHWPLLYFIRTLGWEVLLPWTTWAVVPASILLAALTYYLIEKPAKKLPPRASAAVLMLCMALTGYVGWNVYVRHGMDFRERMAIEAMGGAPAESSAGCLLQFAKYEPKFCRMHDDRRPPDALLLGDSMGHNAFPGMAQAYASVGKNLAMVGWPGVAPLLLNEAQIDVYEAGVGTRLNALLRDLAADRHGPQIIFSFRSAHGLPANIAEQLQPTLDYFGNQRLHEVMLVLEPPSLPFAPILCVGMPPLRPQIQEACELPVSKLSFEYLQDRERMKDILRLRGIPTFDAHEELCDSSRCGLTLDGRILYRTTRYLTEDGSRHVYGNFMQKVRVP